MTVLSISHWGPGLSEWHKVVDKLLAGDALLFLSSALLSFISMRKISRAIEYEAWAEVIFISGLGILAFGAVLLAFTIA